MPGAPFVLVMGGRGGGAPPSKGGYAVCDDEEETRARARGPPPLCSGARARDRRLAAQRLADDPRTPEKSSPGPANALDR